MTITNAQTNTRIDEISRGIYRISTPIPRNPALPAGFSFNQFLIAAEAPLLFHTGPKSMFELVREAVASGKIKDNSPLPARMVLTIAPLNLTHEIDGAIKIE